MIAASPPLEGAFRDHRRVLWGLCYRMTGCAADADDIVQETFARAIERPPARTDIPWRPWLVRVAMNLARDQLRRRRRRGYTGPWLPSPVEPSAYELSADDGVSTAGRYDLLESVSFAFLLALEALTPQQRAVLLLRDVFDYSVRETAQALAITEANVKTTSYRARRRMRAYDSARPPSLADRDQPTLQALHALMQHLLARDVEGFTALLADEVQGLSDGGGEFHAARVPLIGPARIARFYFTLLRKRGAPTRVQLRTFNGLPAIVADMPRHPGDPPRSVMRIELDDRGLIVAIHSILATRKLTGVQP